MKRSMSLALILCVGMIVSYYAASANGDDGPPPEWLNQPGQADPDAPNQIAVTGASPEQATYVLADWVAENLAKADSAAVEEPPVPGDVESLDEIYRARAAQGQGVLEQLCLQLATDDVLPEPCR